MEVIVKKSLFRSIITTTLLGIAATGSLCAMNGGDDDIPWEKQSKKAAPNQTQPHGAEHQKHDSRQQHSTAQPSSSVSACASANATPTPLRGMDLGVGLGTGIAANIDTDEQKAMQPASTSSSSTTRNETAEIHGSTQETVLGDKNLDGSACRNQLLPMVEQGNYPAVKIIIGNLQRLNIPIGEIMGAGGNNALHIASRRGDVRMRKLILKADQTLDTQQNNDGKTPYELCSVTTKIRSHVKDIALFSIILGLAIALLARTYACPGMETDWPSWLFPSMAKNNCRIWEAPIDSRLVTNFLRKTAVVFAESLIVLGQAEGWLLAISQPSEADENILRFSHLGVFCMFLLIPGLLGIFT